MGFSGCNATCPVPCASYNHPMPKVSFRTQVLRVREEAILSSVNRLLAERGYDLMTMDQVAADVGISKASLYKHFASKEELAAAAMIGLMDRMKEFMAGLSGQDAPVAKLKAVVRWAIGVQLAGEMPSLPSQNSSLRGALAADRDYMARLMDTSDQLGEWIVAAQESGALSRELPPEVVLYALYARGCDPVLGVLKAGGNYSDEQIADLLIAICFDGLAARPPGAAL